MMRTRISESFQTPTPTEADASLARESGRRLSARGFDEVGSVRIQVVGGDEGAEPVALPASAMQALLCVLDEMSRGNAVTLMPTHAELTTQQAADILNVSRPYVVKLLDEGKMPSRTVGKYRRVRLADLMTYKRKDEEARLKALEELSVLDQELGLGYEP